MMRVIQPDSKDRHRPCFRPEPKVSCFPTSCNHGAGHLVVDFVHPWPDGTKLRQQSRAFETKISAKGAKGADIPKPPEPKTAPNSAFLPYELQREDLRS